MNRSPESGNHRTVVSGTLRGANPSKPRHNGAMRSPIGRRPDRMIVAWLSAVAVVGSACGHNGPVTVALAKLGRGEGLLNLVAFAGYAEDGTNDVRFDWVHPFEKSTGCQVTVKYANTSDEVVGLLRQGNGSVFDGGSVSGDAVVRLVERGVVAPLDPSLLPGRKDLLPPFLEPSFDAEGGRLYGVPSLYGPNLLLYNAKRVSIPLRSWQPTWVAGSTYQGKVTAFGQPISIADAALYLMAHQPQLGITDPYELTAPQLDAAVGLLRQQASILGKRWQTVPDEAALFASGDVTVGMGRALTVSLAASANLRAGTPREGMSGWVDSWMLAARAAHPVCMYRWIQWTLTPQVEAEIAAYQMGSPAVAQACPRLLPLLNGVRGLECGNVGFLRQLHLWKTPSIDCGDGRTDCTDYAAWSKAFASVSGS
jgi:putative spermidine/putrescine transport system substrate-binding protein